MQNLTKEDIKSDPLFKTFLRSRNIKEKTIQIHETRLTLYCNYLKKFPTELIEEAEEESVGVKMRSRKIVGYFLDYTEYLEEKKLSHRTIKGYMATVKAFYNHYEIVLPKDVANNKIIENPASHVLPTMAEIKKVLDLATVRDKSIILLHLSSAMGAAELRSLRYSHFVDAVKDEIDINDPMDIEEVALKVLEKKDIIGKWDIRRIKTGRYYTTFSSPECMHAIANYLLDRIKTNKTIATLDSALYTSHSNDELGETSHFLIFERLNDRAGLGFRTEKRRLFTSHQLRRVFASELTKVHVDNNAVELLSGRKITGVRGSYVRLDVKWLKEEYLKGVKAVSIEKLEVRRMETEDVKKLEALKSSELENQRRISQLEQELQEQKQTGKRLEGMVQSFLKDQLEKDVK